MAQDEIPTDEPRETEQGLSLSGAAPVHEGAGDEPAAPTQLGAAKYVHAAFVCVGVLSGYVASKVLVGIWNALAAWPAAVRAVPQLLLYGEDERPSLMLVAGAVIGILVIVRLFRSAGVRKWSDDVALELSKVVWPTREIVTNGTIVVIVASVLATLYVGLLDRLWGFVTTLVYGA